MTTQILVATKGQLVEIEKLLIENNLPVDDIQNPAILFFTVSEDEELVGVIGLEKYESIALLRSLAVAEKSKGKGIGKRLVDHFLNWCLESGVSEIYLLTTTADQYFLKNGFLIVSREDVPEVIKGTSQFKGICPSSAVVLAKKLG